MAIIEKVEIKEDYITLGQFLKLVDLISSGGEVKAFLSENTVLINHEADNRRGRKLYKDDLIEVASKTYQIC
ncbi:MAG: S4 domain-containing protein YaaA [Erysipelotrichaceae bacterium]|nr:S4 domain-containing protein YaaA [Erysipelotrichaceae bacterium]